MNLFAYPRLMVLWIAVGTMAVGMLFGGLQARQRLYDEAFAATTQEALLANTTLVEHTEQILREVDTVLRAVREYYQRSGSIEDTERFIARLHLDGKLIETVFLIDASGQILIPAADRAKNLSTLTRDYFVAQQDDVSDRLYLSPVSRGQVTGKHQFRLSRRLLSADGSFTGVVMIPLEPTAFTRHFQRFLSSSDSAVGLLGTNDQMFRARAPEPSEATWQKPIQSPLWSMLEKAPSGEFFSSGSIDSIQRRSFYRTVGEHPLVLITGFTDRDVQRNITRQLLPLYAIGGAILLIIIGLATAITLIHGQREAMRRLATTDALTGLHNRRHLIDTGTAEFARAARYGHPLALMLLDIDHFKTINDTWGHPTGDRVLVELSQTLRRMLRSQDIVGRFGGEEFLVVLPATELEGAWTLAERIRAQIDDVISLNAASGQTIRFNVSIGLAVHTGTDNTFEQLLARADRALYAAKGAGRNRVEAA